MASAKRLSNVSIRLAKENDLNAILALLLTSFRQFPLFDFLYSPLNNDLNAAHDTVFFWRRRLLLNLLDPDVSIIVAEASASSLTASTYATTEEEGNDAIFRQSVKSLEWTERNGLLNVSLSSKDNVILGFAIWRFRAGEAGDAAGHESKKVKASWYNRCRASVIALEVAIWNKIYQRKDQEPTRYAAYGVAEEELSKNFYQESCFYLDNLCVDFRCQRYGVGTQLVQWGLKVAKEKSLWIGTEASPKGLGLYLKLGFKQVGLFTVTVQGVENCIPVLRLPA